MSKSGKSRFPGRPGAKNGRLKARKSTLKILVKSKKYEEREKSSKMNKKKTSKEVVKPSMAMNVQEDISDHEVS